MSVFVTSDSRDTQPLRVLARDDRFREEQTFRRGACEGKF